MHFLFGGVSEVNAANREFFKVNPQAPRRETGLAGTQASAVRLTT